MQKARLLETIRALGCVQLDTISVVSRSHETVLWSRLGPYDLALLGELHYPDGLLTEYWAHAAAIIPVETFPYFRDAMDAYREKYERHPWVEGNRDVISGVLERIRANGATASRHFERPDGPRPEAWTWYGGKPARQALDHLWSCGDIMVARRESGFQRVYDVTERIIPSDLLSIRPSAEERQRFFSSSALARPRCGDGALGCRLFPGLGPSLQHRQGQRGRNEGIARGRARGPRRGRGAQPSRPGSTPRCCRGLPSFAPVADGPP